MLTENHIKKIWVKMTRVYGHKWSSNFGSSDDGTWLSALKEIPEAMIVAGLNKCLTRQDPWPPSLPEFRQMCLNLPSVDKIYQEVTQNRITNELSLLVRKKIPSWDWQTKTEKQLKGMVSVAYDELYEQAATEVIKIALGHEEKHTLLTG